MPDPGRANEPRTAVGICALAFLMLGGYALARPTTESLFLDIHGSAGLPLAWAAVALVALCCVGAYNAAARRVGLTALLVGALGTSALALVVLLSLFPAAPHGIAFGLYVWKDVHIVLLLEALWTLANVVFATATARRTYGLFCAAGSLGGIAGNLSVGPLAAALGTVPSLWVAVVLFGLQAVVALGLGRAAGRPGPATAPRGSLGTSLGVLRQSSYLGLLLLLVGVVQVVITLVDYQYNVAIEAAFPHLDRRTAVIGQVYAAIDASSLLLQLGTPLVLRGLGLRVTLLGIPLVIGVVLGAFAALPRFALMAVSKVLGKALDYSLFRAAKEMLYIPLSYAEKTQGKALIDMLTYRVAKGGTSILLVPLGGAVVSGQVTYAALGLVLLWVGLTSAVTARYDELRGAEPPPADLTRAPANAKGSSAPRRPRSDR